MDTYVGIDGGGTRTRAWLIDDSGRCLGRGIAGPSNPNNVDRHAAVRAIREAVAEAHRHAKLEPGRARALFAGCAGLKTPEDGRGFSAALASTGLAERCAAANDTRVAAAGAFAGGPGVVLIAGTGSFCLGVDPTGAEAWRGGWGWLLDDLGGAFWLGREALHAVVLAADGRGPATALSIPVLKYFGITEPDGLLAALYTGERSPTKLADLAPLVVEVASSGDPTAGRILKASIDGSVELVQGVVNALQWPVGESVPVAIIGGLGCSGPPYSPMLHQALRAADPRLEIASPSLPPVAGAALLALRQNGIEPSPVILANLVLSSTQNAVD